VKKPVSNFAFQVHNLQRYTTALAELCTMIEDGVISVKAGKDILPDLLVEVGLCTLNQVDP
jgi:Asp-tRNA(Asn)/Glu-tRNA(Gln) amidotransferase B subunit